MAQFDMNNWNPGKVSLFQAFGLTGATYPQLGNTLAAGTAVYPQAGSVVGSPGNPAPTPSGQASTNTQYTQPAQGQANAQIINANEAVGKQLATSAGWGTGPSWQAFNSLVESISGWNSSYSNPSSTAYGIGGFENNQWSTVGYTRTSDPKSQVGALIAYIQMKYKTPQNAWAYYQANGHI